MYTTPAASSVGASIHPASEPGTTLIAGLRCMTSLSTSSQSEPAQSAVQGTPGPAYLLDGDVEKSIVEQLCSIHKAAKATSHRRFASPAALHIPPVGRDLHRGSSRHRDRNAMEAARLSDGAILEARCEGSAYQAGSIAAGRLGRPTPDGGDKAGKNPRRGLSGCAS